MSAIDYGQKIANREVRNALQTANAEMAVVSGRVATFVATLTSLDVASLTGQAVNSIIKALIIAGLMAPS